MTESIRNVLLFLQFSFVCKFLGTSRKDVIAAKKQTTETTQNIAIQQENPLSYIPVT